MFQETHPKKRKRGMTKSPIEKPVLNSLELEKIEVIIINKIKIPPTNKR